MIQFINYDRFYLDRPLLLNIILLPCDRPIATACLLPATLFPLRPMRSLPCFHSCMAFLTLLCIPRLRVRELRLFVLVFVIVLGIKIKE